jgi:hypothetical protein
VSCFKEHSCGGSGDLRPRPRPDEAWVDARDDARWVTVGRDVRAVSRVSEVSIAGAAKERQSIGRAERM